MRRLKWIALFVGFAVALVAATFVFTGPPAPLQTANAEGVNNSASGPLDGLVFASELGLVGKPADIKDSLVFENGKFLSTECEQRCNYPASAYFVRQTADAMEFISESRCPDKDATIVWRGTVEGDRIKGVSTWTIHRWYWSVENKFHFEGRLSDKAG